MKESVTTFVTMQYRHLNAATVNEAIAAYRDHLKQGGQMMITLAGHLRTAELSVSLAEMIRRNKVHLIGCTGAHLEENVFNLANRNHKVHQPHHRSALSADEEAMRRMEKALIEVWTAADRAGERLFPHEFLYRVLREGQFAQYHSIDLKDSWLLAAVEKNLPLVVPGWENSTLGNAYAATIIRGDVKNVHTVRTGIEYLTWLAGHYEQVTRIHSLGMFRIGKGIAGEFPICFVPMLQQNLGREVRRWSYFCQINDSTTSDGRHSGVDPNDEITWSKLGGDIPRYIIEADAANVAPFIFAQVLGQ